MKLGNLLSPESIHNLGDIEVSPTRADYRRPATRSGHLFQTFDGDLYAAESRVDLVRILNDDNVRYVGPCAFADQGKGYHRVLQVCGQELEPDSRVIDAEIAYRTVVVQPVATA